MDLRERAPMPYIESEREDVGCSRSANSTLFVDFFHVSSLAYLESQPMNQVHDFFFFFGIVN